MSAFIADIFLHSTEGLGFLTLDLYFTLSFAVNIEIFSPIYVPLQLTHLDTTLKDSLCLKYVYGKVYLATGKFNCNLN
jgi:hypothetical protein